MKFSKLFKKAAAVLMAAVTALSVMPATTAFAAALNDFIVLIGAFFFVHKHLSILWHNADRLFRPWLSFFEQGGSLQALDAVPAACGVSC